MGVERRYGNEGKESLGMVEECGQYNLDVPSFSSK